MEASLKRQVEKNFSRAAATYDQHARQQRLAAERLLREAGGAALVEGPVLEIGCGTGLLSEGLARLLPRREILFTDLSPEMLGVCRQRVLAGCGPQPRFAWQVLDGERLAAAGCYALIVSGFALHWFQDVEGAWQRLVQALRPGGLLLCSYQGEGSFPQWRAQCARLGLQCTANPLPSPWRLQRALAGLPARARFWQQQVELRYASARDFFRSLKCTGASTCLGGARLAPAQFRRLLAAWDESCPEGVEVTAQICGAAVERCQ